MKKRFFFILSLFLFVSMVIPAQSYASDNINVYIDDEIVNFEVAPIIINGRTMVPMRKVFESLGAEVNWNDNNSSIDAMCGYLNVHMQIDNCDMRVNGKVITLDVAPTIRNEKTLVPLRAIAEAFSANVEWISETQTVKIETKYPKKDYAINDEFDNKHVRTSYSDYEYLDFFIDNNTLVIHGYTNDTKLEKVGVTIGSKLLKEIKQITTGKTFEICLDLSKEINSDKTDINIYIKSKDANNFYSYFYNVLYIQKIADEYVFLEPLVLENNSTFISEWINPIGYINSNIDDELAKFSNEICIDATSDYEKLLKIHDWVSENIYYDYDYYNNKSSFTTAFDASEVLQYKRSTCEGYSNLTLALIHAQNIPCRKVVGYASTGMSISTDEMASINKITHAWVQAYVNNRWINIDTTWDSGNKYENGQFNYVGTLSHFNFDTSDIFFAYKHKILDYWLVE